MAHAAGVQFVERSGMKEPHLVPRTAGGDIETLLVRFLRKRPDALVWCGNHAEEHHVTLVSLKCVSVAANQVAMFDFFRFQAF